MSMFREYAEYYDILYRDKDYAAEAKFVLAQLSPTRHGARLLELGCGTGRHAEAFVKDGLAVTGIDLSAQMVEQARRRFSNSNLELKPTFEVGDLRSIRLGEKFDIVISLFHVFSYQTSNADLSAAFETAEKHLAPNGRIFFDFWYGPAVLTDPPQVRVRRIRGSDFNVTRIAEPIVRYSENVVDVSYELIFEKDTGAPASKIRELHPMRYLFLPEIAEHLHHVGLRLTGSGPWMKNEMLGPKSWFGWVSAERKSGSIEPATDASSPLLNCR